MNVSVRPQDANQRPSTLGKGLSQRVLIQVGARLTDTVKIGILLGLVVVLMFALGFLLVALP